LISALSPSRFVRPVFKLAIDGWQRQFLSEKAQPWTMKVVVIRNTEKYSTPLLTGTQPRSPRPHARGYAAINFNLQH